MLLRQEYKDDLTDFIKNTSPSVFAVKNLTADQILNDPDIMERLWCLYQKSVEEYRVDEDYAYRDALYETLDIPMTAQ